MNTNWTGFRPLNVMRVLNIEADTTIAKGAPLCLVDDTNDGAIAWIMDSSLTPRTLPDGSSQGVLLQMPVVQDIRSNDYDDTNYIGIAREDIPPATLLNGAAAIYPTYAQDGVGDCILEGVCYVLVGIPAGGTSIAVGDALFFDETTAAGLTMVTSWVNTTDDTYCPRQVGIAMGTLTADAQEAVEGLILAFVDQFPRAYKHQAPE
jgi:hypothetical protein